MVQPVEARRAVGAEEVGRVDRRLAFETLNFVERVLDRAAGNRDQHRLGVGDIAPVLADPRDGMTRLLPLVGESAADVSSPHDCDLHLPSLVSALTRSRSPQGLPGRR
jgi:hypothetical protein